MRIRVTDAAVEEYVAKIRAGVPPGNLFPARMSECDFSPDQRERIRIARSERRISQKGVKSVAAPPPPDLSTAISKNLTSQKAMNKLRKMLYLQSGNCFFCGRPLKEEEASVEHLNPKSCGGGNREDNEVVCHKTLNHAFGDMDLKRKFEFVLKQKGVFRCPGT